MNFQLQKTGNMNK